MATLFVLKPGGVDPEKPYRLTKLIGSSQQNQSKTKSMLV